MPVSQAISDHRVFLLTPEDATRFDALYRAVFGKSWPDSAASLAASVGTVLVMRHGQQDIGFFLARVMEREAEILTIGILPAFHRQGLGARLLKEGMERCKRLGAAIVFLEVAQDNIPAQKLYQRLGFVQTGMRRGYYPRASAEAGNALLLQCEMTGG